MCGITGILNFDDRPASQSILKRMTDSIAHRGPDGEGQWVKGAVGLGHRRLAILDLSAAGSQPMSSEDGGLVLTYNGEIYNYAAIRTELESIGRTFRSRTDTEVVLQALAEWGEKAVERFNGMFAFALWNARKRTLLLARDRYGIKPLYYSQRGGAFAFGSEVKAILAHPTFRAEVDREAMVEYFTFQNYFSDRTLFEGVRMLPHGCIMTVKPGVASLPTPRRYWDYEFAEPENPADEAEYVEELDRLFRQAVKRHLVSDVEVGTYLSGGVDSGSVTAVAAGQLPFLKSFTGGFDLHSASGMEMGFDEREKAEAMSYLFKTEHYEVVLKAGDMERVFPKLTHHLEEPRVGQSYPNYYVAQLASKFVKVVLSGTGGDELFGGYPWRYYRAVVNDDFEQYVDKYYAYWQRLLDHETLRDVFGPIWGDVKHVNTRDIFRNVFHRHVPKMTRPEDYVNHSLYFEAKTFLHGLLVVEDKLSMAHGLESRVPFLDNDLVDFAMKLPVRLKLGNLQEVVRVNENQTGDKVSKYYQRTQDGKLLLRKVMGRYIPDELTQLEKQGFSGPDASWFRSDSLNFVRRVLYDESANIYRYLDPASVQSMVTEHLDGRINRRLLIWSLVSVDKWLSAFTK